MDYSKRGKGGHETPRAKEKRYKKEKDSYFQKVLGNQ